MILRTERLILRPWREDDAEALYLYARDERVGPAAGWPVHTSADDSLRVLRQVLMADETYAVLENEENGPIGSAGLMLGENSNLDIPATEGEIGYWIGAPYWGRGLIPEAVNELVRHGFEELGLDCIWCGYFDGNDKSRRVQEKCGFIYRRTEYDKLYPLIGAVKTQHISCIARQEWNGRK